MTLEYLGACKCIYLISFGVQEHTSAWENIGKIDHLGSRETVDRDRIQLEDQALWSDIALREVNV